MESLIVIAVIWLAVTQLQMNRTVTTLKKMMALKIAMEINRDAALSVTQLEQAVAKVSEEALGAELPDVLPASGSLPYLMEDGDCDF